MIKAKDPVSPVFRVCKGDTVWYRDPVTEETHTAVCTGHGHKNGRRIHFLDDGHWCYTDQIRVVRH